MENKTVKTEYKAVRHLTQKGEGLGEQGGEVDVTQYEVFPGITLEYEDIHTNRRRLKHHAPENTLEIHHCREGRVEYEQGNTFYYLTPGDLSIGRGGSAAREVYYPISHYHGLSVCIDPERAPTCLSCLLEDVNVEPAALLEKFCGGGCFIMRSTPRLEHIFSELYSVPDRIKKGYFKVKVLELLLFLSEITPEQCQIARQGYTHSQVQLAKGAGSFISAHLNDRLTIDMVADQFHVSATQLKNSFKGVYGVSVYAYIRTQKMLSAAVQLGQTDCTVLDIAEQYGYANGSKFAKAFQDVMGMTPKEFRKQAAAK